MTARLSRSLLLAIHDEQLAEHGGAPGLRDEAALDAALDIPATLPLPEQAAHYAIHLVRGRPFNDGNNRTGYVAMELFLRLNELAFPVGDVDAALAILRLSTGEMDEPDFLAWIRTHIAAAPAPL